MNDSQIEQDLLRTHQTLKAMGESGEKATLVEAEPYRIPCYRRPPVTGLPEDEAFNAPVNYQPPKPFTWADARGVAVIVRDGLLMIVRGIERTFDIGKK